MGLIAPTLPTIGQPNATEDADVLNTLTAIVTEINGLLDSANIEDGSLLDTDLASPNNGVWRPVHHAAGIVTNAYAAVEHLIKADGNLVVAPSANESVSPWIPNAAGLAVAGKTTRLRMVVDYVTNANASAITYTVELSPVTLGGAGNSVALTPGAAALSAAIVNPAASTPGRAVSATIDLAALAAVAHVFSFTPSGLTPAGTGLMFSPRLEIQHT